MYWSGCRLGFWLSKEKRRPTLQIWRKLKGVIAEAGSLYNAFFGNLCNGGTAHSIFLLKVDSQWRAYKPQFDRSCGLGTTTICGNVISLGDSKILVSICPTPYALDIGYKGL
jgi:hypothetical protein